MIVCTLRTNVLHGYSVCREDEVERPRTPSPGDVRCHSAWQAAAMTGGGCLARHKNAVAGVRPRVMVPDDSECLRTESIEMMQLEQ